MAAPDIDDPENLFYLADPFTLRELEHVILDRELEFSIAVLTSEVVPEN
jgi:hypothetical protein